MKKQQFVFLQKPPNFIGRVKNWQNKMPNLLLLSKTVGCLAHSIFVIFHNFFSVYQDLSQKKEGVDIIRTAGSSKHLSPNIPAQPTLTGHSSFR